MQSMKVLIISTYDISGGAAIAAYRLLKGLQQNGIEAQMLVQSKKSDDYSVIGPQTKWKKGLSKLRPIFDSIPIRFYKQRKKIIFSPAILSDNILKKIQDINPDIVHLHWIAAGFIRIETLAKINKPIVWTLHDSWAFTGGCHVPFDCDNYTGQCGSCPQLHSGKKNDLSHWIWKRKKRSWADQNMTIVTDGKWLAACARKSALFANNRIEVINPGLDLNTYKPLDKKMCREILGLPLDINMVLFGAMSATSDKNKGFQFLQPALKKLTVEGWAKKLQLVVFGASQSRHLADMGLPAHYVGRLYDDVSLAVLYSATDVMVVPSIQEAFGQTASESLACGTPVVAFNSTGLTDSVEHQRNGYLARPYEIDDLAHGIAWVLEDSIRWKQLSRNAREKVIKEFDIIKVAKRYIDLYKDVIKN